MHAGFYQSIPPGVRRGAPPWRALTFSVIGGAIGETFGRECKGSHHVFPKVRGRQNGRLWEGHGRWAAPAADPRLSRRRGSRLPHLVHARSAAAARHPQQRAMAAADGARDLRAGHGAWAVFTRGPDRRLLTMSRISSTSCVAPHLREPPQLPARLPSAGGAGPPAKALFGPPLCPAQSAGEDANTPPARAAGLARGGSARCASSTATWQHAHAPRLLEQDASPASGAQAVPRLGCVPVRGLQWPCPRRLWPACFWRVWTTQCPGAARATL